MLTAIMALASVGVAEAVTETAANKSCAAWVSSGGQGTPPSFRVETSGGFVTCTCSGAQCSAQTFTDAAGNTKAIGEALNFLQQAMGMIQSLLGNKGGSGGSGSGSGGNVPAAMNLPSLAPPPADFMPDYGSTAPKPPANIETKTNINTAIDAVVKDPAENFLEAVSKGFSNITDRITEVTVGITQKNPPAPATSETTKKLGTERPDIRTTEGGKAIEIGASDDNTGVAGFYGASSAQTDGLSLVGRLCVTRPWANSFVASIIAPKFFDGLCDRGGYQVGALAENDKPVNGTEITIRAAARAAAENTMNPVKKAKGISCIPAVLRQGAIASLEFSCGAGNTLTRTIGFRAGVNDNKVAVRPQKNAAYGITCSDGFEESCEIQVVNPRITLWSDPKTVRLGTRATVYWNTADVEKDSCVVKGPSFSETGSYGGASTVPISGPSTYTVTCTAVDGEPLTESITVDLAL